MSPPRRRAPWSPRSSAFAAISVLALLALPAGAQAFDTGPHSDITRDALSAEGFGGTATDVVVVNNWFVDLYSNSSKIPQSGHADTSVSVLGAFFENDEAWPQAVLDGANRTHFDASLWDVSNAAKAQLEWDRLQRSTTRGPRSARRRSARRPARATRRWASPAPRRCVHTSPCLLASTAASARLDTLSFL